MSVGLLASALLPRVQECEVYGLSEAFIVQSSEQICAALRCAVLGEHTAQWTEATWTAMQGA